MKLHRTTRYNPEYFSLIPLVNVLVLVLAFPSLSHYFVLSPGVSVNLPISSFALSAMREARIVHISAGPTPRLYLGDRPVTLAELGAALDEQSDGPRTIVIRADRSTPYEVVAKVTNLGLTRGYAVSMAGNSEAR